MIISLPAMKVNTSEGGVYSLQMFTMHQGQNANARSNTQLKIHHGPGNSSRLVHGRTYPNM